MSSLIMIVTFVVLSIVFIGILVHEEKFDKIDIMKTLYMITAMLFAVAKISDNIIGQYIVSVLVIISTIMYIYEIQKIIRGKMNVKEIIKK